MEQQNKNKAPQKKKKEAEININFIGLKKSLNNYKKYLMLD